MISTNQYPIFQQPDPETIIRRFMDFTKYVSLISSSSLFFSRIDKLDDEYEGSLPVKNLESYKQLPDEEKEKYINTLKNMRRWIYVNCWYTGKFESSLMWKAYSQNHKEAVAIQTTYQKLQHHLPMKNAPNIQLALGKVQYINYDTSEIPQGPFQPFIHKRIQFESEQEIRSLALELPHSTLEFERDNPKEEGMYVEILPEDLNDLIDGVYISPTAPKWFYTLVDDITKKYDYDFSVEKSQMSGIPQWKS